MIELAVIKIILAISLVVGLSFLAENVSPKAAGIISGYPTISTVSLFFFGLEVGPEFAAKSAVYNIIGVTATLSFVYFYYKTSGYFDKFNILLSSISAILGYFIVVWLLHFIRLNKFIVIFIPIIFAFLFIFLFKEIKNKKKKKKIALNYKVIVIRALFAAIIILIITSTSRLVGSTWAGLASGFPATIFPLMLIVHYTYGKKHVYAVIKNIPIGIFSVLAYSMVVSIAYPLCGIYFGTVIAFIMATIYLIAYSKVKNTLLKQHKQSC
ncbi:MAG: hypothetical protein HYU98_04745 [Deltaproteobacteria bacterium]|nr:hypothetical protein [Deltaproteobacteria bacterium]